MSFLDILFGRSKPAASKTEAIFAIATGYITLVAQLELTSTNKAGVCFRPLASSHFDLAEKEMADLLRVSGETSRSKVSLREDAYGFQWVILEDPEFEDLVALIYLTTETLRE